MGRNTVNSNKPAEEAASLVTLPFGTTIRAKQLEDRKQASARAAASRSALLSDLLGMAELGKI